MTQISTIAYCFEVEDDDIGAGSVIVKDIPVNVIAVGNPCRVIREIAADDAMQSDFPRTWN